MKRKRAELTAGSAALQLPRDNESAQITKNEAIAYLLTVKENFKENPEKSDEFVKLMQAFSFDQQGFDRFEVIRRVKYLFKDHAFLLWRFNIFLPKNYQVVVPYKEFPPKKQVQFNQVVSYIDKIKTRFQDDGHMYKNFMKILSTYRNGDDSINDLFDKVKMLFFEHNDLLEEFTHFLPDSTSSAPVTYLQAYARNSNEENMVKGQREKTVPKSNNCHEIFEGALNKDVERTSVLENGHSEKVEKKAEDMHQNLHKRKLTTGSDNLISKQTQMRTVDGSTEIYELDDMCQKPYEQNLTRRSDDLIAKQRQMGPVDGSTAEHSQQDPSPIGYSKNLNIYPQELDVFDKAKTKIGSNRYQELLKCINMHKEKKINAEQLQSLVLCILREFPDLMDDFNEIVAHHRTGNNDFDLQKEEHTNHMKTGKGKEKERDNDRVLEKESERNKGQNHEKDRKKERNKSTTRSKESNQRSRDMSKKNASPFSSKVELINKPISELDLSDCERCTPSYCMLPKNYQKPVARYCTDLAKQVLNDSWVSVTSGSEDYSFKHMQKNRYEEALFNCEDDRYELDMLIESTASTIQDIQELLEKIHDNTIERNGHIKIEEHLSAISLRCIESLYGDHGLDLIDELCKNPCRGLPIIQKRLQQKHGEWCKCRAMWNKIWADVYAKNYHGSLDCRNLHVSQNDRKSLSKKALLQDIREISARKSREDGGILTFAAGYSTPFIPHLKSKYPDPALHEDLYKIIKYSSNEVCTTTEESDQVMRVWTIFLEDMLGFPLQSNGGEDLEELVEFRNCNAKKIDSFVAGTSSNISKSSHGLAEEINSKAESEREVEEMANKHSEDFLASSDCFAVMAKPLIEHVDSTTLRNTSDTNYVFYGNDAFYVLLRLYQSLYEQILFAKENALAAEKNWKSGKDTPTPKLYSKIMDLLYSLLDGSSDNSEFEYECRAITGKSYMMFMLDKLIFKLVKQLQTIALGEMENNLLNLGLYERWRSPSNFSDVVYHANAYKLLNGENIYRFEFASHSAELSIQLMEWGPEKLGVDAKALEPAFSDYLYNNLFSTVRDEKERHQIFLSRNMRKYGSVDESYSISKKMKGVTIVNGLLQTISCNTSKVKCVMGTEDLVFRKKIKQ